MIPRYRTAFLNPFSDIPALDILCSYYTKDGKPLESAPEYTLRKAHEEFKKVTGMEFQAMGELEYYVISEKEDLFETPDQRGYHELYAFLQMGQSPKGSNACHRTSGRTNQIRPLFEVGNFTIGNLQYEQNEIEFLPVDIEEAADQLVIAKWILRTLAYQYRGRPDLRTQDHDRKSRKRITYPYPSDERRKKHVYRKRSTYGSGQKSYCRYTWK